MLLLRTRELRMTHFLKRALFMLVPATLTGLVLCVPVGADGNPQLDYSVGGGQIATFGSANNACFPSALSFGASAHVQNDTLTTGVGGMVSASCVGGEGHIVSKVDCVAVSGNVALVTSVVTHSTGVFAGIPPGTEISNSVFDSGVPGGMGDIVGTNITNAPCNFNSPLDSPIAHGDIHVHDAP